MEIMNSVLMAYLLHTLGEFPEFHFFLFSARYICITYNRRQTTYFFFPHGKCTFHVTAN